MWKKASSEIGRMEPRERAKGTAFQEEGCDQPVLSARRALRGDLINGKTVLPFLCVCRIAVDLKSTPSTSPHTEESLQLEKSETRLQYGKERKEEEGSSRKLTAFSSSKL